MPMFFRDAFYFLDCCWETFYMFAYCGLVGNPHLTAKSSQLLLPFQRQPSLVHGVSADGADGWPLVGSR